MTINDNNPNFKEPQRRYQRHGRARKSPAHSSAQVQPASDSQSGSAENTSGALFDSARNTSINGGQFTAAANVNRNLTININATEGVTPQTQTENCHSQQATSRSRNRRRGSIRPQQNPTEPVQRSNEIYERHLRLKKRGRPLWIPQSNMVLPIPYRAQGARIGDVGIFTENGGFDFLFNICVPRDDPINPGELPENFVPISPAVNPTDIRKFAEFSPGSYLTSSSVAESRTAEQSSGLIFESSASEGAILTMPEGAYSEDLSNFSRLRQYIATHAEDWYKFVNGPRSREAQNGDLRVVVGCDKTTSWVMATFANSSLSQDTNFRLKFSALGEQSSQHNARKEYTWEHSGVADVRVGPGRGENEELGETDSNRLRNQCLFLRTLNVTLAKDVWAEIFPQTVVVPDQNSSHSEIWDQSMPESSTGHELLQPSISYSSQNLPFRWHNSTANLTSSDFLKFPKNYGTLNDLVPPNPMASVESVALASQLAVEEEANSQISFNMSPNPSRCEEIHCDSTATPDVTLTFSSSCNSVLHPSKIINQYLLEQVPNARVAVTHDRDWGGIIDMGSCHSDPSQLLSVLHSMNDIVLDNDTGLVFLELKENDQNDMLLEEAEVAGLIESIKDGRLTLDQYLFGSHGDHCLRLQNFCNALRSGSAMPMSSFLTGHPERPLSLDELLKICNRDVHTQGSTQRQSIVSLRAELSLLPFQHADRSSCLLRLGDALSRRFSQWGQRDDLEEAIWSYEEALSLMPTSHYQYVEALLGLCSSLYRRFYLLGHADDLKNLLKYLELQYDLFHRRRSLLASVESQLENVHRDLGSTEEGPESGPSAQSEDIIQVDYFDGIRDAFTKSGFTYSDGDLQPIGPKSCLATDYNLEADQRWTSKSFSPGQLGVVYKSQIDYSHYTKLVSTRDNNIGSTRRWQGTICQEREPSLSSFRPTPAFTSPIDDHSKPPRSNKKKALLVGVESNYEQSTEQGANPRPLKGPHKDIRDMRQFLIEYYHYDPDNITLLINTEDPEQVQPTRKNIEQHCVEMVAGACKGDRFFFHFAGHTTQKEIDDENEADRKNEYIVTCDDEIIQDKSLRKMLVDPLPAGATLVAVFDACNSGTLLDLKHYRCNRVYVPWVNKGSRRTDSRWNITVRRCAMAGNTRSITTDTQKNVGAPEINFSPYDSMSMKSVMPSPANLPAQIVAEMFPIPLPSRRSAATAAGSTLDGNSLWYSCPETPILCCNSPSTSYCTGHCEQNGPYPQSQPSENADVICLSSAKDCQCSWQNAQGYSVTQAIIKFLTHTPGATIGGVLTAVSHELHRCYLDMHQNFRQYKRQIRNANKKRWMRGKQPLKQRTVEMDNFQDPQISSHRPLDMKRLWEM